MHPEVAFSAYGTCRGIHQRQDAESLRHQRNFCSPFRTFIGPTLTLRQRTSDRLGFSWEKGATFSRARSPLQTSEFLGFSSVSDLNCKFCSFAHSSALRDFEVQPDWYCASKNASHRNLNKPRESLGFRVEAEKSRRPRTSDRKSGFQNASPAERMGKKLSASRKHASNHTVVDADPGLESKRFDSKFRKNVRRARKGNAIENGETLLGDGALTERSASKQSSQRKYSSKGIDGSNFVEERLSFGRALLRSGVTREKRQVLKNLRLGVALPTQDELNDVLTSLCRQRRTAEAHDVMDAVKFMPESGRQELMHNVKTYTIMIDICGKSRQLAKAFSLFYGMQREGLIPNVITYNAMVAACSRNNEPDLAFEVFKEMQRAGLAPDKFTYGALIDSCAKCGKVDRAFEIADIMERRKIHKDQTIYSALMDACGRANQVDRAFSVYEEMKRCGVWPNLITFSVLIDTCANAREPGKAFELFAEVKHWGFPHANVVVYTALIDACAKAGWQDQAQLVLEAMIRDNVQPNEITYGALIDGWSRAGCLDEAFISLREMIHQQRVAPNAVLLGGLAESIRRLREYFRAKELWEIMVQHSIRISRVFYPSLMAMAAQNGDVDVAIGIAFHSFTSGFLRRCGTKSDDPCSRALADAIIFVRSTINESSDSKAKPVRQARMKALYESTMMSVAEMDSVSSGDAFNRCVSWGDHDQARGIPYKRRGERIGNSKARLARETGLRSLRRSRSSSEERG